MTKADQRFGAIALFLGGIFSIPGQIILPMTGYPESLQGMGGGQALPLYLANVLAFRTGYLFNGISAILVFFGMLYIARVASKSAPDSALTKPLTALAIASGTLRSLWWFGLLTQIPLMATLWQQADEAGKAMLNLHYILLNDFLSTMQEDVGVNLFGGSFLLLFGISVWRSQAYPKWVAISSLIASISFIASSSEFLGIAGGSILPVLGPSISGCLFIAMGVLEWVRASRATDSQSK
jgi:hypothetical protein